jgi:hypothetical protein
MNFVNSAYFLSMVLTVLSNIAYHFCQKGISTSINPLVSLLATYATAIGVTLVLLFFNPGGEKIWTLTTWSRLNWASFALGLAAVGLELGFLWVYRVGWKISVAAIYSNALVTLALLPIGVLLFHEGLTLRKGAGILLALSGLWALTGS